MEEVANQPAPATNEVPAAPAAPVAPPPAPEGSMNYAGFLIRLVAAIIDGVILSVVNFPIGVIFGSDRSSTNPFDYNLLEPATWISTAVGIAYAVILTVRYGGTVGKMAMGLRVVNEEGEKIDYVKALIRESVGKWISAIALGIGYIWVAFDSKKQGWHDKLAGTYVIKVKK